MEKAEYVDRVAIRAKVCTGCTMWVDGVCCDADPCENLIAGFLEAQAADVAPVRHARWIMKHKHRGGFRRYTGIDDMGEPHTITVDERVEYDDRYCSECGKQSADNFLNYCPNCGAKMDIEGSGGAVFK